MPKTWIYVLSLLIPLAAGVLVMDTRFFLEFLWSRGYADEFYFLNWLSTVPEAQGLLGGFGFPVFMVTVFYHWFGHQLDEDEIEKEYFLLPIAYIPFAIAGNLLVNLTWDAAVLYSYPVLCIIAGYLYILPWCLFVWVFSKLNLLAE